MSEPDKPTRFRDLSAEDFPFTVEALNSAREVVWSVVVTGPGALDIPGLAAQHGPVTIRMTTPTGVYEA